ncbi:MAG: histidinol-phosphatase [Alphaproteobacteria bacterium]|nr:MAG: histidinol-phosphatase [Alphaproteobacteria bacterium]
MTIREDEIAEFLAFGERLADAAAAVTLKYFRAPIDVEHKTGKGDFDPVTRADREAETVIRDLIATTYPHHGILGEELGLEERGGDWTDRAHWVIDPIDGTRAFISGLPLWGTLIAFNDGERPALGIVDFPATRERFVGAPGQARLGTRLLKTRACPGLDQATLSTTDPDLFATDTDRAAFKRVAERVRLTRYGCDCYAYCMVAAGFMDLVVESGLAAYDVQALIPLVEAAGGIITGWDGRPADQGGRIIAAGDRRIHEQAMSLLNG